MSAPVGYSGTPLPKKLGIAVGGRVLVVAAPGGFALGPLPDGVRLHSRPGPAPYDVVLAFCLNLAALLRRFEPLAGRITPNGALWISWPKKSGGLATDLTENVVREVGLAAGLVDVKVVSVDATWSGLKFVYRLAARAH